MVIPNIIHQTWRNPEISPPFRNEWRESWKEEHPRWEYRFWTDADLREFVASHYPKFLAIFDSYDEPIKRVDAARYFILNEIGGLFVDLDFACLKPIDPLVAGTCLMFGSQFPGDWTQGCGHICNALMAGVPGHPFWQDIEVDLGARRNFGVTKATGPRFLTDRLIRFASSVAFKEQLKIISHSQFYPVAWNDEDRFRLRHLDVQQLREEFPAAYAATFWTATWKH